MVSFKRLSILIASILSIVLLVACDSTTSLSFSMEEKEDNENEKETSNPEEGPIYNDEDEAITKFIFFDDGISYTSKSINFSISKTVLIINKKGIYHLSGSCNDGNIIVDANDGDVTLLFADFYLKSIKNTPILINESTNQVNFILKKDTINTIEDYQSNSNQATIYARSNLNIIGNGVLNIISNNDEAIYSSKVINVETSTVIISNPEKGIISDTSLSIINANIVYMLSAHYNEANILIASPYVVFSCDVLKMDKFMIRDSYNTIIYQNESLCSANYILFCNNKIETNATYQLFINDEFINESIAY